MRKQINLIIKEINNLMRKRTGESNLKFIETMYMVDSEIQSIESGWYFIVIRYADNQLSLVEIEEAKFLKYNKGKPRKFNSFLKRKLKKLSQTELEKICFELM